MYCFSNIFYQFGGINYQFGKWYTNSETSSYQFGISSVSKIINSVEWTINSVKCSETFREFDRWCLSIRYQFGVFPETIEKFPTESSIDDVYHFCNVAKFRKESAKHHVIKYKTNDLWKMSITTWSSSWYMNDYSKYLHCLDCQESRLYCSKNRVQDPDFLYSKLSKKW